MGFWITTLAGWLLAYLLGSVPTAYLLGKLFRGIDIREHGSGSVGATNALRVLGKWPALAVLLVDILKGVAAIALVRWLMTSEPVAPPGWSDSQTWSAWAVAAAGIAALVGHSRPVWLQFSGGKSVAVGLGVMLALAWPAALGALAVFALAIAVARFVSLGSILAASAAIVLILVMDYPVPYRVLITAGGLYVICRHHANIRRIVQRTEPRIGQTSSS